MLLRYVTIFDTSALNQAGTSGAYAPLFAFSSRTDITYLHLSLTLPFSVYLMQCWMLIAAINVQMPCSSQSNRYGFRIGMVQMLHASDFPEFPCGKFQKFRLFTAVKSSIYHQSHICNPAGLIEPIMMKLFILKTLRVSLFTYSSQFSCTGALHLCSG